MSKYDNEDFEDFIEDISPEHYRLKIEELAHCRDQLLDCNIYKFDKTEYHNCKVRDVSDYEVTIEINEIIRYRIITFAICEIKDFEYYESKSFEITTNKIPESEK